MNRSAEEGEALALASFTAPAPDQRNESKDIQSHTKGKQRVYCDSSGFPVGPSRSSDLSLH